MPGWLVVDDALVAKLFEELTDVGANFCGIGVDELSLQFRNYLGEGALAVAAFQNLAAGALQLDRAFGEKDHAIFGAGLLFGSPAAFGGKMRAAGIFGSRHG